MIERLESDQFNMLSERVTDLFESPTSVPLSHNDPPILPFLKQVSGLSPEELRCLELFKQGKSAQQTEALLGLSRRTVEHYFENIKNKLGCASKFDLLHYA